MRVVQGFFLHHIKKMITYPQMGKKTEFFTVRHDDDLKAKLDTLKSNCGINGSDIARAAIEATYEFYRENGFITSPLKLNVSMPKPKITLDADEKGIKGSINRD